MIIETFFYLLIKKSLIKSIYILYIRHFKILYILCIYMYYDNKMKNINNLHKINFLYDEIYQKFIFSL